jgi:hypothetical protein
MQIKLCVNQSQKKKKKKKMFYGCILTRKLVYKLKIKKKKKKKKEELFVAEYYAGNVLALGNSKDVVSITNTQIDTRIL